MTTIRAIRLKPDFVEAYIGRAHASCALGRYKEALNDYSEAIRLKPDNDEIHHYRSIAQSKVR